MWSTGRSTRFVSDLKLTLRLFGSAGGALRSFSVSFLVGIGTKVCADGIVVVVVVVPSSVDVVVVVPPPGVLDGSAGSLPAIDLVAVEEAVLVAVDADPRARARRDAEVGPLLPGRGGVRAELGVGERRVRSRDRCWKVPSAEAKPSALHARRARPSP